MAIAVTDEGWVEKVRQRLRDGAAVEVRFITESVDVRRLLLIPSFLYTDEPLQEMAIGIFGGGFYGLAKDQSLDVFELVRAGFSLQDAERVERIVAEIVTSPRHINAPSGQTKTKRIASSKTKEKNENKKKGR